jgi:hypothetical protein
MCNKKLRQLDQRRQGAYVVIRRIEAIGLQINAEDGEKANNKAIKKISMKLMV